MENKMEKPTKEELKEALVRHIAEREKEIAKHPNDWVTVDELKKELERL